MEEIEREKMFMPISEKRLRVLKANNEQSNFETRTYIKNALLILLNEKGYDDIRMTDIIRKSGVSRSAVYKNYKSKDEILVEIYREPIDEILSALSNSIFDNLELIFKTGKKHEKMIRTIIDAGLEHNFLDRMNERFENVSASFYIPLWNGMIFNAFFVWAKEGMNEPVDETIERLKHGLKLVKESLETGLTNSAQNSRRQ